MSSLPVRVLLWVCQNCMAANWRFQTILQIIMQCNGEDVYKDRYDIVLAPRYDVSSISGSNELYSFRGASAASADGSQCTVKRKFMQCYCAECRAGRYSTCPCRVELGRWETTVMTKIQGSGHRRTRNSARDEACQHCGSTDAGGDDPSRWGTRNIIMYRNWLGVFCLQGYAIVR